MIQQLLDPARGAWFAQTALVLFVALFLGIVLRALTMRRKTVREIAGIVLHDDETELPG